MDNRQLRILLLMFTALALVLGGALASAQSDGDAARPYLGITFETADEGVQVTEVLEDSPAAEAGLESGDIITALNGESVDAETLRDRFSELAAGDSITLEVLRDDETLTLEATLGEYPATPARPTIRVRPLLGQRAYLGVGLEDSDEGPVIAQVNDDSPAAEAGLEAGDVITAVEGEAVEDAAAVVEAIQAREAGDEITLSISRDSEAQDVTVTLGARHDAMPMMMGDVILFDGEQWQVVALSEGSPLAAAGLQAGDVITAIDGETADPRDLADLLESLDDDAQVTLTVERDGESQEITVSAADLDTLGAFGFGFGRRQGDRGPRFEFRGPRGQFGFAPGNVRLGVTYQDLDEALAEEHGLDISEGALVVDVVADSPADAAGLQTGDVITGIGGDPVDAQRTLRERLLAYEAGDTVTLDVLRDGETLSLEVTLETMHLEDFLESLPFQFGSDLLFGDVFRAPRPARPAQPQVPSGNV